MISRLVGRLLEFILGEKHWKDAKLVDHPKIKVEEENPDLNKFEQVSNRNIGIYFFFARTVTSPVITAAPKNIVPISFIKIPFILI